MGDPPTAQTVVATQLPADGPWDQLETLGFVRREPVPGDELSVDAILPAGWKQEATEHAMWSKVVDDRGIERVSVFNKEAASYGRQASCHVVHVGAKAAQNAIWGAGPAQLPDHWAQMTDTEKADTTAALLTALTRELDQRKYLGRTAEGIQKSDRRIARIEAVQALIQAATAAKENRHA